MKYHLEAPHFEQFEAGWETITPLGYIPELGKTSQPYFRSGQVETRTEVDKHLGVGNLFECVSLYQCYRVLVIAHFLHSAGTEVLIAIDDKESNGDIERRYHLLAYRDPASGEKNHSMEISTSNGQDILGKMADSLCQSLGLTNLFEIN